MKGNFDFSVLHCDTVAFSFEIEMNCALAGHTRNGFYRYPLQGDPIGEPQVGSLHHHSQLIAMVMELYRPQSGL